MLRREGTDGDCIGAVIQFPRGQSGYMNVNDVLVQAEAWSQGRKTDWLPESAVFEVGFEHT
jgi:hypothetical protein